MKKAFSLKKALRELLITLIGGHRQRWDNKRRLYAQSTLPAHAQRQVRR